MPVEGLANEARCLMKPCRGQFSPQEGSLAPFFHPTLYGSRSKRRIWKGRPASSECSTTCTAGLDIPHCIEGISTTEQAAPDQGISCYGPTRCHSSEGNATSLQTAWWPSLPTSSSSRIAPQGGSRAQRTSRSLGWSAERSRGRRVGSPSAERSQLSSTFSDNQFSPAAPSKPEGQTRGGRRKTPESSHGEIAAGLQVTPGKLLNVKSFSHLKDNDLQRVLRILSKSDSFRYFAGRAIMDFKFDGVKKASLRPPFDFLNPALQVMMQLAACSLGEGEDLAAIQLIVNYFKDGGSEVKPHRHRCRQICLAIGASRELEVEGAGRLTMKSGDALHLAGELHSVPPARAVSQPRVSLCLFYASALEYREQTVSVNATTGHFGDSFWWSHPKDLRG